MCGALAKAPAGRGRQLTPQWVETIVDGANPKGQARADD
jgi:hypothetical protein